MIALVATCSAAAFTAGCGSAVPVTPLCSTPGPSSAKDAFNLQITLTTLPSGLQEGDITLGCGQPVKSGQAAVFADALP